MQLQRYSKVKSSDIPWVLWILGKCLFRRKTMQCPNCHAEYLADDLYCRHCGADLTTPSTSLVPSHINLPAVIGPQLPRVAAGVGALAVGFGLELLRRNLLARLTRSSRSLTHVAGSLPTLSDLQ